MEIKKGWLERREFERIKDVLKVTFYPVDENKNFTNLDEYKDTTIEKIQKDTNKSTFVKAMTEDISKGGLAIVTDFQLKVNQHIIIDLFLPKLNKPIKLLAEVRHIEKTIKGSGSYKAGVKILSISKSDLKRIENRILEIKLQKNK